jgi:hypothetical protein
VLLYEYPYIQVDCIIKTYALSTILDVCNPFESRVTLAVHLMNNGVMLALCVLVHIILVNEEKALLPE